MARRTRSLHWHTQNFLRDPALARALVNRAELTWAYLAYEICAGSGTITEALADRCRAVIANEIDAVLCEALRSRLAGRSAVQIRCGDFLEEQLPRERYKVFANPPFEITSAVIAKLAGAVRPPDDAWIVVQREAAARYCGVPDETLVGLLLKPFFATSVIHRFRRDDFVPPPRVETVMLRLHKRGPPLVRREDAQAYRDLVVAAFTAWKPTVGAALVQRFGRRAARRLIDGAELDPTRPPSAVPFDAWLALFGAFTRMPGALRRRVAGAEARLRRQQAHLQKEHRSRAPRDALGPALARGRRGPTPRLRLPVSTSGREAGGGSREMADVVVRRAVLPAVPEHA
ncbi:N/A [soil metagenome]